jgi:hypothetical protein
MRRFPAVCVFVVMATAWFRAGLWLATPNGGAETLTWLFVGFVALAVGTEMTARRVEGR